MYTTLYINPLTTPITLLISTGGSLIEQYLDKNLDTASTFPKLLVDILDTYDITDIWCVTGPGPFTLMRVITLAINTLTYTRNIRVTACHFFDLISPHHIPLIEANPREYLIQQDDTIISILKGDIVSGIYEGIFADINSTDGVKWIQYKSNWEHICGIFGSKDHTSRISPLYFKPPHITCQKVSI